MCVGSEGREVVPEERKRRGMSEGMVNASESMRGIARALREQNGACKAMFRVKSEGMIEKGERRWMGLHNVAKSESVMRDTKGLEERQQLLGD